MGDTVWIILGSVNREGEDVIAVYGDRQRALNTKEEFENGYREDELYFYDEFNVEGWAVEQFVMPLQISTVTFIIHTLQLMDG